MGERHLKDFAIFFKILAKMSLAGPLGAGEKGGRGNGSSELYSGKVKSVKGGKAYRS